MAASVAVCSCNLPQFVSSSRATLRQSRSRDPSDDSGALYASVLAKRRQAPRARRLAVTGRSSDRPRPLEATGLPSLQVWNSVRRHRDLLTKATNPSRAGTPRQEEQTEESRVGKEGGRRC